MDSWMLRNTWGKDAQEQLGSRFVRFENDMERLYLKYRGLFTKSGYQISTRYQKAKFQVRISYF